MPKINDDLIAGGNPKYDTSDNLPGPLVGLTVAPARAAYDADGHLRGVYDRRKGWRQVADISDGYAPPASVEAVEPIGGQA